MLHEYHVTYSVRYYPRFHVTAVGLGTYHPWIRGNACVCVCVCVCVYIYIYMHKGKAVPLQAWRGPKGSRKLRFPDYMTTAQNGGKVVSLRHRLSLPPGNASGTHFS